MGAVGPARAVLATEPPAPVSGASSQGSRDSTPGQVSASRRSKGKSTGHGPGRAAGMRHSPSSAVTTAERRESLAPR